MFLRELLQSMYPLSSTEKYNICLIIIISIVIIFNIIYFSTLFNMCDIYFKFKIFFKNFMQYNEWLHVEITKSEWALQVGIKYPASAVYTDSKSFVN